LPEHVVEAVEGHDGATHVHFVVEIVDEALGGGADDRALDEALANDEAAVRAGELDPHAREFHTGLVCRALSVRCVRSGRNPLQRAFAAHREIANIQNAVLRRLRIGARWIHRYPHLAAIDLRIGVGQAEECACVGALDIENIAAALAAAQVGVDRGVTTNLPAQREALDRTAAPRHPHIEATQGLAVETSNGAEPDIEVEIVEFLLVAVVTLVGLLAALLVRGTRYRLLDEAAAIEHVAPHHYAQRIIGPALRAQRRLVTISELEHRQLGRHDVARVVDLDGAFDLSALRLDAEIIKSRQIRLVDSRERGAGLLA